jgi:hypothetical protein
MRKERKEFWQDYQISLKKARVLFWEKWVSGLSSKEYQFLGDSISSAPESWQGLILAIGSAPGGEELAKNWTANSSDAVRLATALKLFRSGECKIEKEKAAVAEFELVDTKSEIGNVSQKIILKFEGLKFLPQEKDQLEFRTNGYSQELFPVDTHHEFNVTEISSKGSEFTYSIAASRRKIAPPNLLSATPDLQGTQLSLHVSIDRPELIPSGNPPQATIRVIQRGFLGDTLLQEFQPMLDQRETIVRLKEPLREQKIYVVEFSMHFPKSEFYSDAESPVRALKVKAPDEAVPSK